MDILTRLFPDLALVAGFSGTNCQIEMDTSQDRFFLSGSFDDCGFVASHEEGELVFSNEVSGQFSSSMEIDGIFTSEVLSFPVSCRFADTRNRSTCLDSGQLTTSDFMSRRTSTQILLPVLIDPDIYEGLGFHETLPRDFHFKVPSLYILV